MRKTRDAELADMWARHSAEWRDTAQVCSQWREAENVDPRLLESRATRGWWSTLERLGVTLMVTREYEHLVMAASVHGGRPKLTYLPLPHPSGLAVDREKNVVYLASTRNPNQVYTLKPIRSRVERSDVKSEVVKGQRLAPASSAFYPGCLYLHDLAMVGGKLYGNSVGQNCVVRLDASGSTERVWWPKSIERDGEPVFSRNYLQLNSIAAGRTLRESFFSASSAAMGRRRPGHLDYPVDGQGVIFSGKTREPMCTGLTRPHSARLHDARVWVANSGYGEIGFAEGGKLQVVSRLPGWSRGLCMVENVAFVATSRVIPRYARYAPGLDVSKSRCGVHAVCCETGSILGSLEWPYGNQVFGIDWMARDVTSGFVFETRSRRRSREIALFYTYLTD